MTTNVIHLGPRWPRGWLWDAMKQRRAKRTKSKSQKLLKDRLMALKDKYAK